MEFKLRVRKESDAYHVQMNQATVGILSLLFEFKLATSWQIARFLGQKDQSRYVYLKLHRMWQAGLLESFKVYLGSRSGMPVYYLLSQVGLNVLQEHGVFTQQEIQNYPETQNLLSWTHFKHESQIVELASMEARNTSKQFTIAFKGESTSGSHDFRSDKNIEVFTPDYTVVYAMDGQEFWIYSEFERTQKSKEAMVRKIERYLLHLTPEQRARSTLRIIFQTPAMEQSFWLNMLSGNSSFLQKLRIVTTNILLLEYHEQFLEPIYVSERTARLTKEGSLAVDISQRIKLFYFL